MDKKKIISIMIIVALVATTVLGYVSTLFINDNSTTQDQIDVSDVEVNQPEIEVIETTEQ